MDNVIVIAATNERAFAIRNLGGFWLDHQHRPFFGLVG